jgi:hypothetical protein
VRDAQSDRPALTKRHELTDRPEADEAIIPDIVSAAKIEEQIISEMIQKIVVEISHSIFFAVGVVRVG